MKCKPFNDAFFHKNVIHIDPNKLSNFKTYLPELFYLLHCGEHTGKKQLSERVHNCQHCGHTEQRDIASAKIIRNRGLIAVGHTVSENACGVSLRGSDVLAGFEQLTLFEVKCH